ncbi:MAG TPA: hypothetical protein VIM29_09190 [Bacillota bacterium]
MVKDWMISGIIAGGVAAVIQNIYGMVMKIFGYGGPFYIDYGKIVLFKRLPQGVLSDGLGLIAHLIWDIVLAMGFAYILHIGSSHYLWVKGLIYEMVIWFFIEIGAVLYRIPLISEVSSYSLTFF